MHIKQHHFLHFSHLQGDTVHLIYSYHADDPVDNKFIPQHSNRGTRTINLFGQLSNKPPLPQGAQFIDVRNSQVA